MSPSITQKVIGRLGLAATLLVLVAAPASAQPVPDRPRPPATAGKTTPRPPAPPPRTRPTQNTGPWHKGVSPANKTKALALYNLGNTFFAKSQWAAALRKYSAAIKLWDHPGIRYNMAKCLMELKRYLQAHQSLKLALRYGAAPLDPPRLYNEGRFLLGVLNRLLARVRIVCRQPGVKVTLDGQPLFTGPGEAKRLMDPAQRHVVVATKHKHITVTRTLTPMPGRLTVVSVKLMRLKKTLVMKRRWRQWVPWSVMAAGAVIAAIGIPFVLKALNDFDKYDQLFDADCNDPRGCFLSDREPATVKQFKTGVVSRGLAISFFTLGAVGIAAGVTLIFLNFPRAVSTDRPAARKPRVSVLPAIHRGGGSVTLKLTF